MSSSKESKEKETFYFIILHEQKSKLNLLHIHSVNNDSFSSGVKQTCSALKHYTKNIALPSTLCQTEIFQKYLLKIF